MAHDAERKPVVAILVGKDLRAQVLDDRTIGKVGTCASPRSPGVAREPTEP